MATASPHIVVVGSVNMDLIAEVSRLPAPGETVLASQLQTAPGGKGGNQAVAAARLGARAHMIACIGADDYGGELKSSLSRDGVDVTGVRTVDAHTGIAMICVDGQGQNQITAVLGANGRLTAAMIDSSEWTPSTWVVAQLEVPLEAVQSAFRQAKARGARTLLNAAPAREIPADLWILTQVLVVNETEAAMLSGGPVNDRPSAVAAARALRDLGPEIVAVTLGADGAVIVAGEAWHIPALSVTVVDTTAAGDAWVGAFAVSLGRGADLMTAAAVASVAGALTATGRGAQPSLPHLSDVTARLPEVPAPKPLG
jgi:ribokinase